MNIYSNLYFYITKKWNINKLLYNYNNKYFTLILCMTYTLFSIFHKYKLLFFNHMTQAFSYFFL